MKAKRKTNLSNNDVRFDDVKFKGTFRPYQRKAIDDAQKHLAGDKKIHIVASPGSGKTVLGLELIRMLGKSALVLSPTIAIKEQWRERFRDMFLPDEANADDYVSCTLAEPKLITSITYQGLYTSFKKMQDTSAISYDDTDDTASEFENYSTINIIEIMREHKIGTICLDEAHHLRAEWQKALYEFVHEVEHNVTIISLTATPPYDSKKSEWDKYINMCGAIDTEIFVPELVRAKTLCPHQDYIYYSFPTDNESDIIKKYQDNVEAALKEIFDEGKFLSILQNSGFYLYPDEFFDELSDREDFLKAMTSFLNKSNVKLPKWIADFLDKSERNAEWDLSVAESLFQTMLTDDTLFTKTDSDYVKNFFSRRGLIEKNKINLITNSELEKLLFSSHGKLASINSIVKREVESIGQDIRLLILTDYIKESSKVLGSESEISELGVVPIFELLRRGEPQLKLAALSGKIVIVPNESLEGIKEVAKVENARIRTAEISNTAHSILHFEGGNSAQKVGIITKAFNQGIINAIVGTKSLLGEGWDSPVINTLILASCVGSFMLSNQMRGRAIRIDKNVPQKVSNIWHLTAILPEHLIPKTKADIPPSADYATLQRRFQGFMGLDYYDDKIQSSLSRANTLFAPFNEHNVSNANDKSFTIAADRMQVASRWDKALQNSSDEVIVQNEIPKPKKGFFPALIMKPTHYSTVKKVTRAIMKSFKELKSINKKAKPIIEKDYATKAVNVGIIRCSQHEKSVFHEAIGQVLSAIDSPKYILVKKKGEKLDYRASFAVPEVFSKNKESAEVFQARMSHRIADFDLIFTRSAEGKKHLIKAKKRAYVNKTNNEIQSKMKLKAN